MNKKLLPISALIAAVFLFLFGLRLITMDYRNLHRNRLIGNHYDTKHWQKPSPAQVDYIRSWMTFKYINKIFGLPDSYLQTALGISDQNYPNVTIRTAAQKTAENEQEYLQKLEDAVRLYLAPSTI